MDVSLLTRGRGTQAALGLSVALNVALFGVILWPDSDAADAPEVEQIAEVEQPQEAAPAEAVVAEEPEGVEAETPEEVPVEVADAAPAAPTGIQVTSASIQGSIPQTLATAAAPYGDFLSATLSRLLVWDMDLRRDLRAGDTVATSWTLGTSDTVVVQAARFHSQKFNRTTTAYRFKATGDAYASYWSAEGEEVPHRLNKSPLAKYEQITSLLKDRPNHKGMDFKVDVGTPVLASFNGTVTRVNWNWKGNGNCVEVKHDDGVLAKYLHLSENRVKIGDRVKQGTVLALSGNTGRSTGPHLHYQLNKGKKVLDPIKYHGTTRRQLPEGDKAAFAAEVEKANALLAADNGSQG